MRLVLSINLKEFFLMKCVWWVIIWVLGERWVMVFVVELIFGWLMLFILWIVCCVRLFILIMLLLMIVIELMLVVVSVGIMVLLSLFVLMMSIEVWVRVFCVLDLNLVSICWCVKCGELGLIMFLLLLIGFGVVC